MDKVKAIFITIGSALASWFGILAIPILILLGLNLTDYITGIAAAKYRNEKVSSDKGIRGIGKKLCILLLVAIGAILDWVIIFAADTIGLQLPFTFVVSIVVVVWLICNEIISILENIVDIGVTLPPFLQKIAQYIRKQTELKAEIKDAAADKGDTNHE